MKTNQGDQQPLDVRFDEHDALWHLLGRAPMPEPHPWFATRTLARCRTEGQSVARGIGSLWHWALGGGLGICLAVGLLVAQIHSADVDKQKNVQEAFAIMASADTGDVDSSSTSSPWPDSSL
jgi:hypothetical protein